MPSKFGNSQCFPVEKRETRSEERLSRKERREVKRDCREKRGEKLRETVEKGAKAEKGIAVEWVINRVS